MPNNILSVSLELLTSLQKFTIDPSVVKSPPPEIYSLGIEACRDYMTRLRSVPSRAFWKNNFAVKMTRLTSYYCCTGQCIDFESMERVAG